MSILNVMKVGLGEIGSMPRGRKKKEKTEEEKLEERVNKKEKEFIEGKKVVKEEEEEVTGEQPEEQIDEQPKKISLEEVIYGLSGQAALLDNLNRFELTPAEHDALSTGVEFITNTISNYIEELKETERGKLYAKGVNPLRLPEER
jgi:hypothetical protein